jgi:hypothetical protein
VKGNKSETKEEKIINKERNNKYERERKRNNIN